MWSGFVQGGVKGECGQEKEKIRKGGGNGPARRSPPAGHGRHRVLGGWVPDGLSSFVTHQGTTLHNRHDIAYVDSDNGWCQCDDPNINLIQNVPDDDACITFYIAE